MANLVDLLIRCVDHPAAAGQTFLAADGEDLSTAELLRRLVPVPPVLLRLGGRLTGRAAEVERLIGSLQVDIGKARQVLGWTPPVSVEEELERTAQWYRFGRVGE